MMKKLLLSICLLTLMRVLSAQTPLYFPPAGNTTWDTVSPSTFNWCQERLDTLSNYLTNTHTKAFIILKNGKIAYERYFDTFTKDSLWMWASAGKSLTSFLIGIAQEENLLDINDKTSQYLGTGWTSCTPAQEDLITIRHQLSMSTGLDDGVPDVDCTIDTCLIYKADAGTRWAYHNAPYHLLHDIIDSISGTSLQQFTNQKLKNRIGMTTGFWVNHVFYSRPRDMARFGLLNLAGGIWNGTSVMTDTSYFHTMTRSSQNLNPSYGYLWWLNGKGRVMVPTSQLVFQQDLIPNAPADMYCALGKNDQKIYVVPSQNMVVVRMGNAATNAALALSAYDNVLWAKLSNLECSVGTSAPSTQSLAVFPNPASTVLNISLPNRDAVFTLTIYNDLGQVVLSSENQNSLNIANLPTGIYHLRLTQNAQTYTCHWVKI